MEASGKAARRPRADGVRNRERVLEAAKVVFNAGGADASLEAVAREAGVGIGTLYRHFPTREALFEAVYRREVDQLVALSVDLAAELPPVEALRRWMHANVAFVATKKGMSAALAVASHRAMELGAPNIDRLVAAIGLLLARAVDLGAVRGDVSAQDLLRAMVGFCYMHDRPGWQDNVLRLVDVMIDGLRRGGSR